ncbi:MAG: YbaB/EbfC family nucleoid-associated protein, partial [Flavobacteriaceae bacterium]|nr:YbaB/EbfC family nucleoid-associated protein [Flavobacteriaceae bacterium]
MFGDLSDMMGKLKEAQQQIEATKKRLDTVIVDGQSAEGKIKIAVTANREIKSIVIYNSLLGDKEELA